LPLANTLQATLDINLSDGLQTEANCSLAGLFSLFLHLFVANLPATITFWAIIELLAKSTRLRLILLALTGRLTTTIFLTRSDSARHIRGPQSPQGYDQQAGIAHAHIFDKIVNQGHVV